MISTFTRRVSSTALSLLLVITTAPFEAGAQQSAQTGSTGYSGQGAPLNAEELQQLVAPIALYPDALVAQVLGAATFPDQVAYAADWLQGNTSLTGNLLMQMVDRQPWDPSVKALTQFPSVLNNMAKNLSWTSALGEAYHTQPSDVMSAVQVLRAKAKATGNLKSSQQITVVQESPQVIVIQPANPQVVYVPQYNPTVIYGTPYVVPGYTAPPVGAAVVAFGAGIAVGAMMSSSCCGWGYSYWNTNWHSSTVVYHSTNYYGNNAWHGGSYGTSYNASTGTYARGASTTTAYGSAIAGQAYNPSTGTYARGASTTTAYGTQKAGQAYNPNTGASAATRQSSNAYGSSGSSVYSKNGQTAYTQHQTTSQGSMGSAQTSSGGKAVAGTGKYNSAAVGETASGNKYAAANGKTYSNTGSGWQQKSGSPSNSASSKGWGGQEKSGGSSAFGGGSSGWDSRAESARGSASRGGGGGWRGRR